MYPGYDWFRLFEMLPDHPDVKLTIDLTKHFPVRVDYLGEYWLGPLTDATAYRASCWLDVRRALADLKVKS